jgi:uncharacterized protein (DUF2235 family)
MKRLALYLDGTWDSAAARTNVFRLYQATLPKDSSGVMQVPYYHDGVGVRALERIGGGLLGIGLARNVQAAYTWLVSEYQDGDQVFLFGFSRGAYTARSLAGMIARCGLISQQSTLTVGDVYARYRDKGQVIPLWDLQYRQARGETSGFTSEDRLFLANSRRIPIQFIGVWDTVGALGIPFGRIRGLSRSTTLFHNTNPSVLYKNMFQALAINENRKAFEPTLWTGFQPEGQPFEPLKPDQRLEQRWFVGAHTDVGGGKADVSLAQIPLAWIRDAAAACELAFAEATPLTGNECTLPISDSFSHFLLGAYSWFGLRQRYYRPIGRGPIPTKTKRGFSHSINETIDASVFDRWRREQQYRPKNLVAWASQEGKDPSSIPGTIPASSRFS